MTVGIPFHCVSSCPYKIACCQHEGDKLTGRDKDGAQAVLWDLWLVGLDWDVSLGLDVGWWDRGGVVVRWDRGGGGENV